MIRFIELFAGIGGFRYGLENISSSEREQSGRDIKNKPMSYNRSKQLFSAQHFTCVWANEIDKYACQIYRKNYGRKRSGTSTTKNEICKELYEGDIRQVDIRTIPDHDLLCGGFPCQSFSIAGKRKGMSGEDTRGTLFYEIYRIARDRQPRLLLLENVPGLLSSRNGKDFQTILQSLDEIGYDVEWDCINTRLFLPQNRERVFIIGYLRGPGGRKVFPIEESYERYTAEIQRRGIVRGRNKNTSGCLDTRGVNAFDRADLDKIIFKPKIRRLTPVEAERLQGFPDDWTQGISDTQRYKCLGNAVSTPVITAIGKRILEVYNT